MLMRWTVQTASCLLPAANTNFTCSWACAGCSDQVSRPWSGQRDADHQLDPAGATASPPVVVISIHYAAPQIKCGDLYEDGAVQTFNACAVSDKKCVPQRVDEGVYPVRIEN